MKTNLKLKFYVAITFLVFALPFYNACSEKSVINNEITDAPVEVVDENTNVDTSKNEIKENLINKDTLIQEKSKIENIGTNSEKAQENESYFEKKNSSIYNAYELGFAIFYVENELNIKEIFLDKSSYVMLIFTLIIVISILMLVLVSINENKKVMYLSIINLFLAIFWFIYLFIADNSTEFKQIKYGYYLYLIVLLLIIYESRKVVKKKP